MTNFDERAQKAVDIASTYVQVLIGLASGIITAVLAFYPDIKQNTMIDPQFLKIALSVLGGSIIFGLIGLGGLVNSTANADKKTPTNTLGTRFPVTIQLIAFGLGMVILIVFVMK